MRKLNTSKKTKNTETKLSAWDKLSLERKKLQEKGLVPEWYTTAGYQMFLKSYAVKGENSVRGRFETIARTLSAYMPDKDKYEKIFFDLMWDGILSPASPVLANTGTTRGMNVSCSGQLVEDTVDGFYSSMRETALLSKEAFGTSGDFSSIRPRGTPFGDGGKASGAAPVIDDFFTVASKISQGSQRRGAFAAYLDIQHDDFDEVADKLLNDPNGRNIGWTVRNDFIYGLAKKDPECIRRYKKALHIKLLVGKGYFFFIDKANALRPDSYVNNGLMVTHSNLCTEIMLCDDTEHSFSCILSSMNLVNWDKIKGTDAVFNATIFLDCLTSDFLKNSEGVKGLEKVRLFTEKGRPLGLGGLGWHTYLQSKMIPYESLEAGFIEDEISEFIQTESHRASKYLAKLLGEPEWCKGTGRRNTHTVAYAPTKSTSILMGGVSESWYPEHGFCYEAAGAAGEVQRIPYVLLNLMKERGVYNQETVRSIINNLGSVQHVDWLDAHEKAVFKNAFETDQMLIIRRAAKRQKHTCQGQSINLWFAGGNQEDKISECMTEVMTNPYILSQYYFYSRSGAVIEGECLSCAA